jgi:hypothetical protein
MTDPRRHAWSRPGLGGCHRWPSVTNCSVDQPLTFGADQSQIGTRRIFDPEPRTVGIAEVEFRQIPLQVGFAHMEVAAENPALQDGEEPFHGVGVDVVPGVFLGGVVYGLVLGKSTAGANIDVGLVGHEPAVRMGVAGDDGVHLRSR